MFYILLILILITSKLSYAHSVQYTINRQNAVVITIFYADGTPFSYEKFEVYSPDNKKIPFQVGRTDKYGRLVFLPDKIGNWTVKAFSEDGHGIVKKIFVNNLSKINKTSNQFGYLLKIFIGVFAIFLVYGLFYFTIRRKKLEKT